MVKTEQGLWPVSTALTCQFPGFDIDQLYVSTGETQRKGLFVLLWQLHIHLQLAQKEKLANNPLKIKKLLLPQKQG